MTLGQFAAAVGAPPRWVQNAMAGLGLPAHYSSEGARRLALARELCGAVGMPLVDAYPLTARALKIWPKASIWEQEGPEGAVTLTIDLERFLSNFTVRLSLAWVHYAERKRGRPKKVRRRGLAAARAYGVDMSLLESSLRRQREQRLQWLEQDVEFLRSLRIAAR